MHILSYLRPQHIGTVACVLWLSVLFLARVCDTFCARRTDPYKLAYLLLCLCAVHPFALYVGYVGYFTSPDSSLYNHPKLVTYVLTLCEFQIGREMASLACEYVYRERDLQMVVHHVGFMIATAIAPVAYFNGTLSARAIFFFGGISETSTVLYTLKLLFQELVHKPYTATQRAIYNAIRYTFFVLFVAFRLVWWNVHAWDVLCSAYQMTWWIALMMYGTLLTLTGLQFQWGMLMMRIAWRECTTTRSRITCKSPDGKGTRSSRPHQSECQKASQ